MKPWELSQPARSINSIKGGVDHSISVNHESATADSRSREMTHHRGNRRLVCFSTRADCGEMNGAIMEVATVWTIN
jgi:hypothetical protein